MKRIIVLVMLLSGFAIQAQNKNAKASLEVDGVCMMCKQRIEKAAIKIKGVKLATWNLDTQELNVVYNESKTSLKNIQKTMASVGHDTKEIKASDEAYKKLDPCCMYRDPKVVEDHKKGGH